MGCRSGSCDVPSAVGRVAPADSESKAREHLALCYWCLDLNVKAGDEKGAKRWQLEINRIEERKELKNHRDGI